MMAQMIDIAPKGEQMHLINLDNVTQVTHGAVYFTGFQVAKGPNGEMVYEHDWTPLKISMQEFAARCFDEVLVVGLKQIRREP
jgi:hypothetical protein